MGGLATWPGVAPVVLVALAWFLAPGLLVGYAAGLRGVLAWSLAPVSSIAAVAGGAVVGSLLGIRWSGWVAAAAAVALAVAVGSSRLVAGAPRRRRDAAPRAGPPPDPPGVALAAVVGSAVAAVVGALVVMDAFGSPEALSQTYDAVFHYSAVARILADGDASSLTLGNLTAPADGAVFYPAAWHDLVSLVVLSTGATVPVATTAVAGVVATAVWPLSCVALVRVVAGPSWAAVGITPVVAVGFAAFPWGLLGFGVLWPNLVGVALVPAGLALVVALGTPTGTLTRRRAAALLPVAGAGLALGHPSALFSLAVIAVFPLLWEVARRRRPVAGAVLVAVVAGGVWFLLASPLFATLRTFDWPAYIDPWGAVGEAISGGTRRKEPVWVLSVAVLVGVVAALWVPRRSWLVPAHLAAGALFVLAASTGTAFTSAATAFWYNDPYRLAAALPVTGVVLAVLGITGVGAVVHRVLRPVPAGAVAAVATVGMLVSTGGMYAAQHASAIDDSYSVRGPLVDGAERAFFDEVAAIVPPGDVVAQNPWSGSALLWPLAGREVLFPHLAGDWTTEQGYLARTLRYVSVAPDVCAVAGRLDVRWLLVGDPDFWEGDARARGYPGLDSPGTGTGFELRASDRFGNALYELTGCT